MLGAATKLKNDGGIMDAQPAIGPIEYGIPLPKRGGNQQYPWHLLAKGGSFHARLNGQASITNLQCSLLMCARRKGLKVETRRDKDGQGVRVWRLK